MPTDRFNLNSKGSYDTIPGFRKFRVLGIPRAEDLELKMSGRYVIFIFIITIITLIILFPYSPWLVGQDEDCMAV